MRRNFIYAILLAALCMPMAFAQKKTTVKKKPVATVKKKKTPQPVVQPEPEDEKFEEMLEATQQIMFIDSVVVSKRQFLEEYHLNEEAGTLMEYNKYFKTDTQPYSIVYQNQLGNKCWFSQSGKLFTADKLGNEWSSPAPLEGLGRFQRTNYPFVLSDGLTLYFAAISSEGLGGLDIYMSRYDSESGQYLLAENIGLPFNSDANDYMYAIDEFNGVGYFATDRRQPEGMVCIYTFIPNQKRTTYSTGEFVEEVIRSRAKILSIADTWGDGNLRRETLDRLHNAGRRPKEKAKGDFTFFITDNLCYNRLSDFEDVDNRARFNELTAMRKKYQELESALEKARDYYGSKANSAEKDQLRKELLDKEKRYYQLEQDIRKLEKTIRNEEIKILQK